MSPPATTPVTFTIADFQRLGNQSGFHYRLPHLGASADDSYRIAEGRVQEHLLHNGLSLMVSDVAVHEHYESTSLMTPRFSAIVMLAGEARAALDDRPAVRMAARSGLSALYGDTAAITGVHPAGQRLRSVNLTLRDPATVEDEPLADLMRRALRRTGADLRPWQVPPHLLQALDGLLDCPWDEPLHHLLHEGVAAQLLAHALAAFQEDTRRQPSLSSRDRQLLERVRERLHDAPGEDHRLEDLARLACMSPSTLRAKFQLAYHCTIFGWLRQRRLELARDHLARGCSVQQAAHLVGYRHATNFATAFRERYGVAPSALN